MKKGSVAEKSKEIPAFRDEEEEREFWADADSTEYVTWNSAGVVALPNLKPTARERLNEIR